MLSLVISAALCASPTVAWPGFAGERVALDLLELHGDSVDRRLRVEGLDVLGREQLRRRIAPEKLLELEECVDPSDACVARWARAARTDAALLGAIKQDAEGFALSLNVVSARGRVLARYRARASSDATLVAALNDGVASIANALLRPPPPLRAWSAAPGATGVAAVGVGAGLLWQARRSGASPADRAAQQRLGIAALGLGSTALLTAGAMFLWGGAHAGVEPQLVLTPGGATVGLAGTW